METSNSTTDIPNSDGIIIFTDTQIMPSDSSNTLQIADEPHANPIPAEVRANLIRSIPGGNNSAQSNPLKLFLRRLTKSGRSLLLALARCIIIHKLFVFVVSQFIIITLLRQGMISFNKAFWLDISFLFLTILLVIYRFYRLSRRIRIITTIDEDEPAPSVSLPQANRNGLRPRTAELMRALMIQQIQINQARMLLNALNQENFGDIGMPFRARIMLAPRGAFFASYLQDFVNSGTRPPQQSGLSIQQIEEEMPEIVYVPEEETSESNQTCTICLEDFHEGDPIRKAPCQHFFHKQCIDGWLSIRNNCPNCKLEIRPQIYNSVGDNAPQNMNQGAPGFPSRIRFIIE